MPIPRPIRLSIAAVSAIAAGAVHAHGGLPNAAWCSTGVAVEVAVFSIAPATLQQVLADDVCPPPGVPTQKDCGQFDDDYAAAKMAAEATCETHVQQPLRVAASGGDIGTVVPQVTWPVQYGWKSHHTAYSVDMGLGGSCVRCDLVPPAGPGTPAQPPVSQ